MRQETVRILSELIFLKVILVIHALLELVTALMNDFLTILFICGLGHLLIFNLLLLYMNLFR